MKATLTVIAALMFFSGPASCQQKATAPVGVCVQSSTLKFTPAATPGASVGVAYSASLSSMVSGGTAPYTYAISSGALPPGLTLSSEGVISGTPTSPGSFSFSVTVTDSSVTCATTTTAARKLPQKLKVQIRTAL